MKKILLDTSLIIDYLRRKNKEETKLVKLSEECELYISIVTHAEVFAGKSVWEDNELRDIVEKLYLGFTVLPIDLTLSKKAGKIRAFYDISLVDAIIAATAIENDFQLTTLNIKDFENIAGIHIFTTL